LDTSSLLGISVTVGSTGTTSALNLNSGTGRINMTGQLVSKGAVPVAAQVGGGTPTIAATSTDTAGSVETDANAAVSAITITFAATYTAAPVCIVQAADSDAAVAMGSGTGFFADATATVLTITFPSQTAVTKFNYFCIKNE